MSDDGVRVDKIRLAYWCPICGRRVSEDAARTNRHACPEAVLRGIDAAGAREERGPRNPSFAERLKDGVNALAAGDSSLWDSDA